MISRAVLAMIFSRRLIDWLLAHQSVPSGAPFSTPIGLAHG
jgi:hypothetical protein